MRLQTAADLPTHQLCQLHVIAQLGVHIQRQVVGHTVDVVLAALLITGGVIGAQVGVRASKYVSGAKARIFLAVLILGVSLVLAGQLLIAPKELYSLEVRL